MSVYKWSTNSININITMNLISLYEITRNPEELLNKLKEIKLIPAEKECLNCKNQVNICPRKDYLNNLLGVVDLNINRRQRLHTNNVASQEA